RQRGQTMALRAAFGGGQAKRFRRRAQSVSPLPERRGERRVRRGLADQRGLREGRLFGRIDEEPRVGFRLRGASRDAGGARDEVRLREEAGIVAGGGEIS